MIPVLSHIEEGNEFNTWVTTDNYVEAPTFSNATKKALASALTRTADRFSEKLKMVPEYAVLKGPIDIKVIITDEIKAGL